MDKKKLIEQLNSHPQFKTVLSLASDEKERRSIKAHTEEFLMRAYDSFYKGIAPALQKDPNTVKNAFLELEKKLINDNSGSVDPPTT